MKYLTQLWYGELKASNIEVTNSQQNYLNSVIKCLFSYMSYFVSYDLVSYSQNQYRPCPVYVQPNKTYILKIWIVWKFTKNSSQLCSNGKVAIISFHQNENMVNDIVRNLFN